MSLGPDSQNNPILDSLQEMVARLDTELRIQWANRAYADALGAESKDLSGTACYSGRRRRGAARLPIPFEIRKTDMDAPEKPQETR